MNVNDKNKQISDLLRNRTPKNLIKFRIGHKFDGGKKAFMLAYVDARYVQDKLDDVVGSENWQVNYFEINGNIFCTLKIKWADGSITEKTDVGVESNVEKEKGQVSDAFKRTAVLYGVGRDLYSLEEKTGFKFIADLDQRGNTIPYDWKPNGWVDKSPNQDQAIPKGDTTTTPSTPPSHPPEELPKSSVQEIADKIVAKQELNAPDRLETPVAENKNKKEYCLVRELTVLFKSDKTNSFCLIPNNINYVTGDDKNYTISNKYWVKSNFLHPNNRNLAQNDECDLHMEKWIAEQKGYTYEIGEPPQDVPNQIKSPLEDDLPF